MKALLQRVSEASVAEGDRVLGAIGPGLLVLLGVVDGDGAAEADRLAHKTAGLRIFEDAAGKMNRSVLESGGGVLVVSQFTLYGDSAKGRRPSFIDAARPELALPLYERFCAELTGRGLRVEIGEFGAEMQVELVYDGPVTLILERSA